MNSRLHTTKLFLWLIAVTFTSALWAGGQEPGNLGKRDLDIQQIPAAPAAKPVPTVPRGYAVVIGVAKYEKLAPEDNLQFPLKAKIKGDAINIIDILDIEIEHSARGSDWILAYQKWRKG